MYAELHAISNFTFLRGASHPQELVEQAKELGYAALALTDECSMAGVVRAHTAALKAGLKFIVGSEFTLAGQLKIVALATSRLGYGRLCRLITRGRLAAKKGQYGLGWQDFSQGIDDCLILLMPDASLPMERLQWLAERFPERAWLGVELLKRGDDRVQLDRLRALGKQLDLPLVAAGDVHMHV